MMTAESSSRVQESVTQLHRIVVERGLPVQQQVASIVRVDATSQRIA